MTTTLDSELLVLHGLAVKKAGSAEAVGAVLGMTPEDVERSLEQSTGSGRVIGAKGTYMLTPVGRGWLDEQYPTACAEFRSSDEFVNAYERFEVVNKEILDLFTRWQTVAVAGQALPNDHQDEDYDNKIIDQLGDIHERSVPVFDSFASVDPRFTVYKDRFEAAYDKILLGDKDWVSGAKIDSYHTVWFELHEDILRLLGRQRRES
jgi:hypothetical protein